MDGLFQVINEKVNKVANILKHGKGDKINMDTFRDNMDAALKDRMSVKPGKGARWRTLNSDRFRKNFDEIFNHKPTKQADESNGK